MVPDKLPRTSRAYSAQYTCKHCKKVFVKEHLYLAHKCKQMKRLEEFQSTAGQAAWEYYQMWMRQQKKAVHQPGSFLASRYYRTFINFAEFVKKTNLPSVEKFIWLMVEKKYPPIIWTSNEVYVLYLEFLDHKVSPMDQFALSLRTLMKYTDKHDVDVSEVFDKMLPTEVIHMLNTRRLSPWLLLHSSKFKLMFRDKFSPEQTIILENLIRPEFWIERFKQNPKEVEKIKKNLAEIGL